MSYLTTTFNRLCNTRFGYLMIPAVGFGALGFFILIAETAKWLFF